MTRRGFTLIELLVVVSIIGLLSSVIIASLNTARSKARDARRIADFHSVDVAMEMYFEKNGRYSAMPNPACPINPHSCDLMDHLNIFNFTMDQLINDGDLTSRPTEPSPGQVPGHSNVPGYLAYDYGKGSAPGVISVTYLEGVAPTMQGPYGSCRPFIGNWCDSTVASTAYCDCHVY